MTEDKSLPRYLGVAFVVVFLASLIGGVMHSSAVGSVVLGDADSISAVMQSIADNVTLFRASILLDLVNIAGIVALAALLYVVLNRHSPALALIALGWWLAEAIVLLVGKLGAIAMIPLSQQFVAAGAPAESFYQAVGEFAYYGVDRASLDLHMLFFCLGAFIWYGLMYRTRLVPRAISIWGLAAMALVTVATVMSLAAAAVEAPTLLYVPYIPFELTIGLWLLVRGATPRFADVAPRSVVAGAA